ncbi:ATP-binding protein [Vulcanisaeta sp. JCM 14467]|uniref:ATP-binding protein n=1 Tax=Vulcanisaeta sp. JCM 14467 TaxID=1295370 RepID=UPI0006D05476|nr:ATP-binding protein [Vulcanisaeta sp. JCM 14467]
MDRFNKDASLDFLRRGFAELGVAVGEGELVEVYEHLDGVVGWLTLYGYLRGVEGLSHKEALARVLNDGARLVLSELEALIKPSRARYLAILGAVAHGSIRGVRLGVMSRLGPAISPIPSLTGF